MEDLKLAVKRGAYWLDQTYPGWASKINLDNLVMDNCEQCIIGQAVGNYYKTVSGTHWAIENGFDVESRNDLDLEDRCRQYAVDYHSLEVLWAEQVKERR